MSEITEKLGQIERAFDEFKSKQDTVIADEVKKGTADVVRKNEVDEINASITQLSDELKALEAKANRIGAGEDDSPEVAEHKAAFGKWMRKGVDDGLADLEAKALNVTTSADGGYAVPEEIDRNILDLIKQVSPVRALATVVAVGTSDYKKLVNVRGTASGWVGETSTRPETNTPQLAEVPAIMGELYANPQATQRMLDDAFFDSEAWLAAELADEFAKAEGAAFISGNGTNRPKGFLAYTINTSADGARTFGDLQMVKTAVAGDFAATTTSSNPGDSFIDVIHSLKSPLRNGAAWLMNSLTLAKVRKFRDVDGNYIWRPGLAEGQPATILGYAVEEAQDMPDVATNTYPIAFGNWKRGYYVIDRLGTRLLRDPFTNKPYVGFYTTKRVGGMVVDSEAIKILATRT
ncbi:phage major capsid protein [Sphingobium sp. MI1205]|uniref:phage major capsid protein n=1 Tax=Sphingobium sp. MI1205 TaxID=407020 RepID=UPI000770462D|nr:phage major capsid protein [Sphingobium sp. MI1205]AMK19338.1 HK97 family phage major capsid protein [Sphingobium sp. MI1205]